jgi:sensor histidine kinase YesM
MMFFANSCFRPNRRWSVFWLGAAFASLVSANFIFTFANLSLLEVALTAVIAVYLFAFKSGRIVNKLFCALLTLAVASGVSLAAAQFTMIATNSEFSDIMGSGEHARMIAIALSKLLQLLVFWALAKRRTLFRLASKLPATILLASVVINFACILLLYYLCLRSTFSYAGGAIVTAVTTGVLVTAALAFIMFEVFAREENTQAELLSQVQRLEVEGNFYRQIDAMYADMRKWRHDYKNNLLSLSALLGKGKVEGAIEYLGKMTGEPHRVEETLNTPNTALNAIVSAKLSYARSLDIDVALTVAFPENASASIPDIDMCSIVGNLLDNAVEACERMRAGKKFVQLSIAAMKKMLAITVRNSAEGVAMKDGFPISAKKGRYHGIGIKHIDEIAMRLHGYTRRDFSEGVFSAQVLIPIAGAEEARG